VKNSSKHSINKVFLEINTNSKEKGYYLKDNMDAFLQKEIFSVLENYFDELDSKNPSHSIQLEKLNIDIAINPNLDFEDFKQQILNKITKQIEEVYEKKDSNSIDGYKLITAQEKEIESFFYFLETGTNAWWTTSNHDFKMFDTNAFDTILDDETFAFKWRNAVQNPIERTRFIKQFSDEQIVKIIKKGIVLKKNAVDGKTKISRIEEIKKRIEFRISKKQLIPNERFLTWEIVVLSLLETNNTIVKQKLSLLIFSVFEFHTKNSFLKHQQFVLKEINNQTESQNELEVLKNMDAIVLAIEKKLDTIIVKQKEAETEIKIEIESQESKEKTVSDLNLILLKNKDAIVPNNDKNIEPLSNNIKEFTLNTNKEIIDEKEPFSPEKEEETIGMNVNDLYVDNAGLLLVHPFLKHLFENCKLLNNDNTINNPETAVHLLHYAATGREQDYENTMTFEKFLCDIPIGRPIERNIVLPDAMKKEVSEMLQAVLNNWDIMKTSSAELLQNEFLQRAGKLTINRDESPKIVIERKTQDILLDKLSWNLSIIKLAWKKRIIYVDW